MTGVLKQRTSLIGREAELGCIASLLQDVDLVTLFGAPGVGKTKLAQHVAHSMQEHFSGGVWFCELDRARTPDELLSIVMGVLGLRSAEDASEQLTQRIGQELSRHGPTLLVLDNFEQLLPDAASVVAAWHGATRILVTSRETLRLQGETIVEVSGLPERQGVQLFAERARVVRPDLTFSDEDWEGAKKITAMFDGNPLAIELAAARVGVSSPRALHRRLPHEIDILRANAHGVPDRHTSLSAAIEWSWRLLSEPERSTLAQSTVFRAPFTAETAEAIIEVDPGAPPILTLLESLRRSSLVSTRVLRGQICFHLLASVREFAAEHTDLEVARRHALHFASVCGHWKGDTESALANAEVQLDDAIASFRFLATHDRSLAAKLALAVEALLHVRGPFPLRFAIAEEAVDAMDGSSPALEARLHVARGVARLDAARYDAAVADLERALELATELGDDALVALATFQLGNVALWRGQWDAARAHYRDALPIARETDSLTAAKALNNLALIASGAGEIEEALALYTEALSLRGTRSTGTVLVNIGQLHHQAGNLTRSRVTLDDAERRLLGEGDRFYLCFTYICRAWLSIEEQTLSDACDDIDHAEELLRVLGDQRLEGLALITRGVIAAARDLIPAATDEFTRAHTVLTAVGDRGCLDALLVAEGFLDLARSRAAGRVDVSQEYRGRAITRLERLRNEATTGVVLSEARVPLRLLERALSDSAKRLAVGSGWFSLGDTNVDLSRRRAVRLLFEALVEARLNATGALSFEQVVQAGWPGERMDTQSASRRVYVTIHTLRKLGLGDVLLTTDDGYLLDPNVPVVRVQ